MSAQPPAPLHASPSATAKSAFQYRGHDILDLLKEARNYNRWLTDQVIAAKPARAAKITDLGAGRGTFAEILRARGLEIDCVERDRENQVILRERGFSVHPKMEEEEPESIDYVYTLNVLEHVPADEELVRAVFSRLRSGGRLFIFVPAFPILWSRLDDHVEHQRGTGGRRCWRCFAGRDSLWNARAMRIASVSLPHCFLAAAPRWRFRRGVSGSTTGCCSP